MSEMIELTEKSFETQVVHSDLPVLVDFYAPWCGPCKMIAPVLAQLAGEFTGRVKFAKVNVDVAPELAQRHGITGVPSLLLFRDGEVIDERVGLVPPAALRAWLEQSASAPNARTAFAS